MGRVVHWSGPSARTIFFWQVFFVELFASPVAEVRKACAPLKDALHAETRDGILLFLERHVKKTVSKQHPALVTAMRKLVAQLEGG